MKVFRIGSVTGFRGRTDEQILRAFSLLLILCGLVLAIAACVKRPPKRVTMAEVEEILKRAGPLAESSFYACMLNYYAQGLSLQQARDLCAIQLKEDFGRTKIPGGPSEGYAGIGDHSKPFFDPANIVAACNTGDSGIASGGTKGAGAEKYPDGWGWFSWGSGKNRKGLDEKTSYGLKTLAVYACEVAMSRFAEAMADHNKAIFAVENARATLEKATDAKNLEEAGLIIAENSGDAAKIQEAKDKLEAAKKAEEAAQKALEAAQRNDEAAEKALEETGKVMDAAAEKAKEDPNKVNQNTNESSRDATPCEEGLAAAREILRECNRTNWKGDLCQKLKNTMAKKSCPDPSLIYVDPEEGYSCGQEPNPEEVKAAWVAACEERQRGVGPEANPCVPPTFAYNDARFIKACRVTQGADERAPGTKLTCDVVKNICNDPRAYVDPHSEECAATLRIPKTFGEPDLAKLAVWGLNNLGGPIIVIRAADPMPPLGVEPRPGPPTRR